MLKSFMLTTMVLFLCSCDVDLPSNLKSSGYLTIHLYKDGQLKGSCILRRDDPEYADLLTWAIKNEHGWSLSVATISPKLIMYSNDFQLNFTLSGIYYSEKYLQFYKKNDYVIKNVFEKSKCLQPI